MCGCTKLWVNNFKLKKKKKNENEDWIIHWRNVLITENKSLSFIWLRILLLYFVHWHDIDSS